MLLGAKEPRFGAEGGPRTGEGKLLEVGKRILVAVSVHRPVLISNGIYAGLSCVQQPGVPLGVEDDHDR